MTPNEVRFVNGHAVVSLNRGMVTLVDREDYEYIKHWRWSYDKQKAGYEVVYARVMRGGKRTSIVLARVLMGEPEHMEVHHKDHNTMDNRRHNLEISTPSENKSEGGKYAMKRRWHSS